MMPMLALTVVALLRSQMSVAWVAMRDAHLPSCFFSPGSVLAVADVAAVGPVPSEMFSLQLLRSPVTEGFLQTNMISR